MGSLPVVLPGKPINESYNTEIKIWQACVPSGGSAGEIVFLAFSSLEATSIPWLMLIFYI